MFTVELVETLEEQMKELFSDSNLLNSYETKFDEGKVPNIRTGWYEKKKDKEDFPYILISPLKETNARDSAQINVMFIIGTYSDSLNGWKDVSLIAEKIKKYLQTRRTIAQRFEIHPNLEINYPDDQPYPQWFCYVIATFSAYNYAHETINDDFEVNYEENW